MDATSDECCILFSSVHVMDQAIAMCISRSDRTLPKVWELLGSRNSANFSLALVEPAACMFTTLCKLPQHYKVLILYENSSLSVSHANAVCFQLSAYQKGYTPLHSNSYHKPFYAW